MTWFLRIHKSRSANSATCLVFPCLAVMCLFIAGCGKGDIGNRVGVSGKVVAGGSPIQGNASVAFEPADKTSDLGKKAVGATVNLKDGEFKLEPALGLSPGVKYKVIVNTFPGKEAVASKDPVRQPKTFNGTVEIADKGSADLEIVVEEVKKN